VRAVVIEEFGEVPVVRDVPEPVAGERRRRRPRRGERPVPQRLARLGRPRPRTSCCRTCRATSSPAPCTPSVAGVRGVAPGDRVTAPFVLACGVCEPCRRGDQQVCADQRQPGFTGWGSFAEYVVVERAAVNLVRCRTASARRRRVLGCRFATAFRALTQVGRVAPGEWVAVHGCGGVGLSAVLVAVAAGARVVRRRRRARRAAPRRRARRGPPSSRRPRCRGRTPLPRSGTRPAAARTSRSTPSAAGDVRGVDRVAAPAGPSRAGRPAAAGAGPAGGADAPGDRRRAGGPRQPRDGGARVPGAARPRRVRAARPDPARSPARSGWTARPRRWPRWARPHRPASCS
jgi:hypothetical protein